MKPHHKIGLAAGGGVVIFASPMIGLAMAQAQRALMAMTALPEYEPATLDTVAGFFGVFFALVAALIGAALLIMSTADAIPDNTLMLELRRIERAERIIAAFNLAKAELETLRQDAERASARVAAKEQ